MTVAAEELFEREDVGCRWDGEPFGTQQADGAVLTDTKATDSLAIGVGGVGETLVVCDDHPANLNVEMTRFIAKRLAAA